MNTELEQLLARLKVVAAEYEAAKDQYLNQEIAFSERMTVQRRYAIAHETLIELALEIARQTN